MKKTLLSMALLLTGMSFTIAQKFSLKSPNDQIAVTINTRNELTWSLSYNDQTVMENSKLSMTLEGDVILGHKIKVISSAEATYDRVIRPVVPTRNSKIRDRYNELLINFSESDILVFRVYDEGVAYRFVLDREGPLKVMEEDLLLNFPSETTTFFPKEENLYSHYERSYIFSTLDTLNEQDFCSLPVMINLVNGPRLLVTEADVYDYPNLFLKGQDANSLAGLFPSVILETEPLPGQEDRSETITKQGDFIASTSGKRAFPWRVFMVSDDDKDFLGSDLIFQLSRPLQLDHTEWIKPGKVAWDWYNANNVYGVDFKSGINTRTYKYYIDFASKYGLEYVILDEGWTQSTTEIMESNPDIDIPELVAYGKERNVGLILWVLWKPLMKDLEAILQRYAEWGAKGVKVDFMQRADQGMVNIYEQIVKEAAQRKLMVDFHGAFKPGGMKRAYPNLINYEGLKGAEHNKWSADITPDHNLTIPFIRMVAGPMDYTPGSMRNAIRQNYRISFQRPMSQGTRCHQVAMYVVYEAPLQMLCDSPSAYYEEEETIMFISQIPTTWDETRVLEARVGDYVVVARRKGNSWYIGAMTDWTPREFEIDFSFLEPGNYRMQMMRDGINANRFAEDYVKEESLVTNLTKMKIRLSPGGGWSAILEKKE